MFYEQRSSFSTRSPQSSIQLGSVSLHNRQQREAIPDNHPDAWCDFPKTALHVKTMEVAIKLRQECPYLSWRKERGVDNASVLGPSEVDQNAHRAFARAFERQHKKDGFASSGQNATHASTERIHTTAPSATMAFWRRLRQAVGAPLHGQWQPKAGTRDKKGAYRQLGVSDNHLRHSIICVWDVVVGCWRFGILLGLAFGLAEAVLCFNCYPALMVAVARRWLALPVFNFFDGF